MAETHWECPNCDAQLVVMSDRPHTPFHMCPGLKGLDAPMVVAGTRCKVEAVERGDYIGKETVTLDDEGRPIMRVETTRDDGNDVAVYAPCVNVGAHVGNVPEELS